MGIRTSLKGLVRFIIIITMITWIPKAIAGTDGTPNSGRLTEREIRYTISRLANPMTVLTEGDISNIKKLGSANYHEVALAALIRVDTLVAALDDYEKFQSNREIMTAVYLLMDKQKTADHRPYINDLMTRIGHKQNKYNAFVYQTQESIAEARAVIASDDTSADQANEYLRQIGLANLEIKKHEERLNYLDDLVKAIELSKAELDRNEAIRGTKVNITPVLQVLEDWKVNYERQKSDTKLLASVGGVKKNYLEDVERVEDYMKARIVNQNEAVESLLNIEVEKHVKGFVRETPILRVLMGTASTGKETIASAYIDAIHNEEGASKKHLFILPAITNASDISNIMGSAKGFIGSTDVTPLARFVAEHSGGRYIIVNNSDGSEKIIENSDWKGKNLPGFFTAQDGAVLIKNGDAMSSQAKDALLLELLKSGIFRTNGANGSVEVMYTSLLHIYTTTREASELLFSYDENGRPTGKKKSYEESLETYKVKVGDSEAQRRALTSQNGVAAGGSHNETYGMSENLVKLINDEDMILLKPHSADGIRRITRMKLDEIASALSKSEGGFGRLSLSATDEVVNFVEEYHSNPEAGARQVQGRLRAIVEEVYSAIRTRDITSQNADIKLSIQKNADRTTSVVFMNAKTDAVMFTRVLKMTEHDRALEEMSYTEFDRLAQLPEKLNQRIYGNEEAMNSIGRAVAITQQAREVYQNNRTEHKKATTFGLFGYAGLGKTQTAKELTKELTGKEDYLMIDFTNIKSYDDIQKALIGVKQGSKVIPSEFMKAYDRKAGGTLVVLLEETANTHPELLKSLYPFFDESEVRVFADGKARAMSNVIFLVTGNAGLEVYNDILKLNLPRDVKMQAMSWVYESFIKDSAAQMAALSKTMPIPLMTRFTKIFHFRPVNYEILRSLSQRSLTSAVQNLKPKDGLIGWNVGFRTEADYYKTIEILEREGFEFENQGRSIVNYTTRVFDTDLKFLLSKNHVPAGSNVVLVPRADQTDDVIKKQKGKVLVDIFVEGKAEPLVFEMEAQKRERVPARNIDAEKRTAVHEAGHNILMRLLLSDKIDVEFLSIVPGVTSILNEYIFYLGIAEFEDKQEMEWTRQAVIEMLAVDAAGAAAQRFVTKGAIDDAGKSNDRKQATFLARKAVMQWGLSPRFSQHIEYNDPKDLMMLSEADKTIISEEVSKLIQEGEKLADNVIKANPDLLLTLANVLLEKGEMTSEELNKFYEDNKDKVVAIDAPGSMTKPSLWERMTSAASSMMGRSNEAKTHNPEFIDGIRLTDNIASIDSLVSKAKAEQLAKVHKPEIPIITLAPTPPTPSAPAMVALKSGKTVDARIIAVALRDYSAKSCTALFAK